MINKAKECDNCKHRLTGAFEVFPCNKFPIVNGKCSGYEPLKEERGNATKK